MMAFSKYDRERGVTSAELISCAPVAGIKPIAAAQPEDEVVYNSKGEIIGARAPAPDREGELDVAQQEWQSIIDHLADRLDVWEERGAVVYDLSDYLVDQKTRATLSALEQEVKEQERELAEADVTLTRLERALGESKQEVKDLREALEHITELFVDTAKLGHDPEKEVAVINARAALKK